MDPDLDKAKLIELREKIAADNDISVKTLRRWEKAYFEHGFAGLRPKEVKGRQSSRLPENFQELFEEAKQLKREVTSRSVEQIINILELEGKAPPGVLKRSTLQRHLFNAGLGERHLKMYRQSEQTTATRRFCKPHRMMLGQADIKYGVGVIVKVNGKKATAYLSSILDDHSRYALSSIWYENQDEFAVQNVFRNAILKHGKIDRIYTDHGSQYINHQLKMSCAMLGIKLNRAPIKSGKSKGKVEKFHQVVDTFIAEVKLKKVMDIAELNRYWTIFLEEYYHKKPHEGIAEYYKSKGISIPEAGISPEQEWNRDSRPLVFLDANVVAEAFLHHEYRNVDKGGQISFKGKKYEAGIDLVGAKVTVSFDPHNIETITIHYQKLEPRVLKPVEMGEWCAKTTPAPRATQEKPVTSRFLDALEKKYQESQEKMANAISYGSLRKEETE